MKYMLFFLICAFILFIPVFGTYTKMRMKKLELLDKYYYYQGFSSIAAGLSLISMGLLFILNNEITFYLTTITLGLYVISFPVISFILFSTTDKKSTTPYKESFLYKLGKLGFGIIWLFLTVAWFLFIASINYCTGGNITSKDTGDSFTEHDLNR